MGNAQESSNLSSVVLFSGGLDSTVLLALLKNSNHREVQPIFFTYPSRHNYRELKAAKVIAAYYGYMLKTLPIPTELYVGARSSLMGGSEITTPESTIVPFRNGVMLALATAWAENNLFDIVAFAAHATDNPYPDCRPGFVEHMKLAMYSGTAAHVILMAPFIGQPKTSIVVEGDLLRVPFDLTWSCYAGEAVQCGVCPACIGRRQAFEKAGIHDPTVYAR